METLTTARLVLRPFAPGDIEATHRLLYADPEVAVAWAGRTRTLDEIQDSFADKVAQAATPFGFLAVVRAADDALLGTVALQRYAPTDDTRYIVFPDAPAYRVGGDPAVIEVELTYALGRAYWGQGYASEAAQALSRHGFARLGVARIVNSVSSENAGSIALMRRLGFTLTPNAHPKPMLNSDAPGVLGVLAREALAAPLAP